MKSAVDVNLNKSAITGWASSDSNQPLEQCVVKVFRNEVLLGEALLEVQRDDVRQAGLHPTGKCGFQFPAVATGLVPGCIYRVSFFLNGNCAFSKRVFYGNPTIFIDQFNRFELPRDDFSIMAEGAEALFEDGNDLLAFKKLLIRLRRGKRAHGWRATFKGYPYEFMESDWLVFRAFVEENLDVLFSLIGARYLWSIIDTFADYAEGGERLAALAVSNILYQERFAQTFKCIYDFVEKDEKIVDRQIDYWGGMATNRLALDDAYDVFITRNLECLRDYPLVRRFFIVFIKKMMDESSSILGFNINNSDYFGNMAKFYRNHFK